MNTTKKCSNIEYLPKLQVNQEKKLFVDNNDNSKIERKEEYKNSFLKSDNIAIRQIRKEKILNKKSDFLELKSNFGPHHVTYDNSWIPKESFTLNNRSSVSYNILSPNKLFSDNSKECSFLVDRVLGINDGNSYFAKKIEPKIGQTKVYNMKKGVAEIYDLNAPNGIRFNEEFNNKYSENRNVFKSYLGVFSNMYEAARKNGNISVPFKKRSNEIKDENYVVETKKKFKYISKTKNKHIKPIKMKN